MRSHRSYKDLEHSLLPPSLSTRNSISPERHGEMDPTAVTKWLDSVMEASNVTGALLIDSQTGLCLGARGKATEDDATYIAVASRGALDVMGVGAVAFKDSKVILQKGGSGVLVAVYKEKDLLEEL